MRQRRTTWSLVAGHALGVALQQRLRWGREALVMSVGIACLLDGCLFRAPIEGELRLALLTFLLPTLAMGALFAELVSCDEGLLGAVSVVEDTPLLQMATALSLAEASRLLTTLSALRPERPEAAHPTQQLAAHH